tara:strand:+ start:1518 stop:3806 length:2289 start_codon:yes stop_codon:yes gene_type:complete
MARYDTYVAGDDRIKEDLDIGFIGFNNRLRPDQLSKGILNDSQNGRMAQNGEWQTRKGIDNIKAPLATGSQALTLPFALINDATGYSSDSLSGSSLVSQRLRINLSQNLSSTFSADDEVVVYIDTASLTGITLSANNYLVKVISVDASDILFEVQGVTFSSGTPGGTVDIDSAKLADGVVNEVYGSCIFSDPNSNSESYIMLASNTKVVAIKVSNPSTTYDLDYTAGETVSSSVDMIQAFNKLFVFRDNDTALSVDLSASNITSSPDLTLVEKGDFTLPSAQLTTAFLISKGEAKGTKSSHGFVSGDIVQLTIAGSSGLTAFDKFTISRIDGNDFFFFVDDAPDIADGAVTTKPTFIKEVPSDLGYTHMPAPAYGVYHQKRLAVPFRYSLSSTETITDRKIFDEIILSNILDTDTYDNLYGQFRFNAGKADFNVGMLSFSDDKLIVFNRNSIHLVDGSENLQIAVVKLLTDEVGLIARKTAVQVGNQILFLSDNGVYGLNFIDLYNLRGNEQPLSESIQKTIDNIDKENASNSCAVYFDNKYFIAVPTKTFADGSSNTEGINNTLLIYNFLNKSWESIDSVNNVNLEDGSTFSRFEFTNLLVAGKGDQKGVYVTNTDGGIHKLDFFDDGIDRVITDIGTTAKKSTRVQASATTRMFTLNSIDRKKFNNFELHLQSSEDNTSDVSISATTENIDSEPAIDLKNASDYIGGNIAKNEDVSIRGRIGNKRAYGLQVALTSILGRPRFRSLKIAGAETFRSTSSVQ